MITRNIVIVLLLAIVLYGAEAQTATHDAENTVYLTLSTLQNNHEYNNATSIKDSWTFAGGGFIYGHFISRHFSIEPNIDLEYGGHTFLGTFTANLAYSFFFGESSPVSFLECGYGISTPPIFQTALLRLDAGTIHVGGGIKLSIDDHRLLRLGISYNRSRIYNNDTGYDVLTYSNIGLRIGYVIVSSEPTGQK
jgi:hypothetical protein